MNVLLILILLAAGLGMIAAGEIGYRGGYRRGWRTGWNQAQRLNTEALAAVLNARESYLVEEGRSLTDQMTQDFERLRAEWKRGQS